MKPDNVNIRHSPSLKSVSVYNSIQVYQVYGKGKAETRGGIFLSPFLSSTIRRAFE